ncbi:MAG: glycosyl hydrolase [bacterium]|nr:glycosyl hydrolase [bacterium]
MHRLNGRRMICLALFFLAFSSASRADSHAGFDESLFQSMEWREVGPYRGGRSAAVAGIPDQRNVYYFGATGGGVWKTDDGGKTWKPVSDGFFGGSIGAVAVSSWDPNVVYVGGGEKTVRGNVSHGDGMWKSTDAGKTWKHVGLADSRRIPRIRIHPRNPDLLYAAVLGHLFGPNAERGVYRSKDGGETWERILHVSDEVGAVDLAMDPTNPRILYASMWRILRTPWSLESGGEGSSLWKSTDGGDEWQELTSKPGLPKGPLGIIGIDVSASNPENLYAIVEAEKGGVFRSKDGGETWEKTNDERKLRQRAWYYTRLVADPADEESVYVLNVRFHRSKDGGKTFSRVDTPHGDNHDLWIDPGDPLRMIQSNDGGANVSYDSGKTWSPQSNQPTAQMYRVSTDNAFPYRLLGGQQDNSAVRIRSRSAFGSAIGVRDWEPTAGGESGHVVARPDDPDIVYGGSYDGFLTRVNHRTGERRAVNVWPDNPMGWGAAELKYRFQWNFPLFFSPHDPDLLYAAGNVLFASRDGGASWRPLSGDLTRDDKTKMGPSGGPITKDNTSVEYYGTIFAAIESPHEAGVLWAGSDDGLLQLSRDSGKEWKEVTPSVPPKGGKRNTLPEWSLINSIEAHPTEPGGLYLAATRYKLDDFEPYLYKTLDYGATWKRIDTGIDRGHFTRVIRADPDRAGLLYAGTERGVYVSFDDGASWQPLQLELPIVPITDLAVKERDLVAATQGRGYWILDDLTPLHQMSAELASSPAHLFTPRPAYRLGGRSRDEPVHEGKNPPSGVVIHFLLAEKPEEGEEGEEGEELKLEILEEDGELIRAFTRKPDKGEEDEEKEDDSDQADDPRQLEIEKGANRFVWNLRYPSARKFPGLVLWNSRLDGPRAVPGEYRARLTVGEWSAEVPFEVLADPRSAATAADFQEQFDFLIGVRDKLSEAHDEIGRIRDAKGQIEALEKRLGEDEEAEPLVEAGTKLTERLDEIEKALYQTQNRSRQDPLNFPIRLNDKLAGLLSLAAFGDRRPTAQMVAVKDELTAAIDAELAKLGELWETDLPAFNDLAREHEVDRVIVKEP